MSDQSKQRTITLTGRRPVTITESEWPRIASGRDEVGQRNGTPLPDYERALWELSVRQHADGRGIVYGVAVPPSDGWPTHGCSAWKGGELVEAGGDLIAAIQRVGADLREHGGAPASVVRECIADLPPERI